MSVTGGVLTGIGVALTAASLAVAFTPQHCASDDDLCGIGAFIGGGITGGVASAFVAAGIPLIAVGVSRTHKGEALVSIDSIGPRSVPNGGGVGIGGRF